MLKAKLIEVEGIKQAETGDFPGALQSFTKAIEMAPSRASGYNNRAQTLRLMGKINGKNISWPYLILILRFTFLMYFHHIYNFRGT